MEGGDKVAKRATTKPSRAGKDSRHSQNSAPHVGAASDNKRKATHRRRGNAVECGSGSSKRDAEGTQSSSDSDSECGEDELEFIGGVNSDDGSDSDSSKGETELEATFELFDPQDEDAAALLLLLRHSRVYTQLGLQSQQLRALAEVVAGQGNIGSVARAATGAEGRSEAPVGLVTIISVRQYRAAEPLVSKILLLAQKHASARAVAELQKLLSSEADSSGGNPTREEARKSTQASNINSGLFLSCRYTNLPLEVAAEAAEALAEDVKWSLETPEMEEDERPWYRFSHVVGVTLVYRDTKAQESPKKQKQRLGLDFTPTFAEFEQAVLSEGASVAFAAPTNQTVRFSTLPSAEDSKSRDSRKRISVLQSLQEYLFVYAIPYERFERNARQVKQRLAVNGAVPFTKRSA